MRLNARARFARACCCCSSELRPDRLLGEVSTLLQKCVRWDNLRINCKTSRLECLMRSSAGAKANAVRLRLNPGSRRLSRKNTHSAHRIVLDHLRTRLGAGQNRHKLLERVQTRVAKAVSLHMTFTFFVDRCVRARSGMTGMTPKEASKRTVDKLRDRTFARSLGAVNPCLAEGHRGHQKACTLVIPGHLVSAASTYQTILGALGVSISMHT